MFTYIYTNILAYTVFYTQTFYSPFRYYTYVYIHIHTYTYIYCCHLETPESLDMVYTWYILGIYF